MRYDFDELQERWLTQLYHKNDGYFTPIVLVPYRYDSTIINTEKELKLANERVNTLSILMHNEGSDFIEGLIPYNVEYTLNDLKLETTRFLLTQENEEAYYQQAN